MKRINLKSINPSHLITEIISIVIGILLALAVNGLREDYQHIQIVSKSLSNIAVEIQNNEKQLREVIPYHQSCKISLTNSSGENSKQFSSIWKGLNPPMLFKSAYESALALQAFAYMDYKLAGAVSQLYFRQQFFYEMIHIYAQALISGTTSLNRPAKGENLSLQPAFRDITKMESELLKEYQRVLTLIQNSQD